MNEEILDKFCKKYDISLLTSENNLKTMVKQKKLITLLKLNKNEIVFYSLEEFKNKNKLEIIKKLNTLEELEVYVFNSMLNNLEMTKELVDKITNYKGINVFSYRNCGEKINEEIIRKNFNFINYKTTMHINKSEETISYKIFTNRKMLLATIEFNVKALFNKNEIFITKIEYAKNENTSTKYYSDYATSVMKIILDIITNVNTFNFRNTYLVSKTYFEGFKK